LFVQILLESLAWSWSAALLAGVLWFLVQPYVLIEAEAWLRWAVLGGLLGVATVMAAVLTWRRSPTRELAALSLDERFALRERATTSLLLTSKEIDSPVGQALLDDVNRRVEKLAVAERFPVRVPWSVSLVPAGVLALLLIVFFYHPQPGQAARDESKQPLAGDPKLAAILAQEMKQLQNKAIPQKSKPGDLARSAELDRLEEQRDKLSREKIETREQGREVVKEMGNLEEQMQKRAKELAQRADALREQFKQAERLRKKPKQDGPANKVDKALDQGNMNKAQDELKRLAQQLEDQDRIDDIERKLRDPNLDKDEREKLEREIDQLKGKGLTPEQREKLRQQLKDLQDKLDALANKEELEKRLKDMAARGEIDPEELAKALEDLKNNLDKLDPQTLKDLQEAADKLGECQRCLQKGDKEGAAKALKAAAAKLGKCAGEGECQALAQQIQQLQAARRAICQALDGNNPASGQRPLGKEHETKSQEERARSELDKGRQQLVDFLPGEGLRNGPVKRDELTEEIRQASQAAPEAIDRQRLPRSASDMAKGYFEKLRGPEKEPKKP